MKHNLFLIDDGSLQVSDNHFCDICREKGSSKQIYMHYSFFMCERCKNWYNLLPGVLIKSLQRYINGNVL
jgi:hypothetical protein